MRRRLLPAWSGAAGLALVPAAALAFAWTWFAPAMQPPEPVPAQRFDAALVANLRSPAARTGIDLQQPADRAVAVEPPVFAWRDPDAGDGSAWTLHLVMPSGQTFATFETGGVAIREPRWAIPTGFWLSLPAGVRMLWRVRRLPDRSRGETVSEMPHSPFRELVRGE